MILFKKNGFKIYEWVYKCHRKFMTMNSHILLVEDDPTLQDLIEKLLINNNYLVSKAGKINEADKLIKLFTFDLILLDIMLPDFKRIRFYVNNIKDRINSPVIFLFSSK